VQFDHGFGNGKAQSHTAMTPGEVRLNLKEAIKDMREVAGGNADAIVCYANLDVSSQFFG